MLDSVPVLRLRISAKGSVRVIIYFFQTSDRDFELDIVYISAGTSFSIWEP